jgi:hypothetical protein
MDRQCEGSLLTVIVIASEAKQSNLLQMPMPQVRPRLHAYTTSAAADLQHGPCVKITASVCFVSLLRQFASSLRSSQ